MDPEYIRSGQAVQDVLERDVLEGLPGVQENWRKAGKVDPFMVLWPGTAYEANGELHEGPVVVELPVSSVDWPRLFAALMKRTNACAVMLCIADAEGALVTLESEQGVRSWRMPVKNRGDHTTLGEPTLVEKPKPLGLL
jgi:hypothetical protein